VLLTPEEAGCTRTALNALEGGDPAVNADRLKALLEGGGSVAEQEAVALNAGALLWTAARAGSFREGTAAALDALRSGAAGRVLGAFVETSRG
jgi:anthranilate phosphoribosyltransferase